MSRTVATFPWYPLFVFAIHDFLKLPWTKAHYGGLVPFPEISWKRQWLSIGSRRKWWFLSPHGIANQVHVPTTLLKTERFFVASLRSCNRRDPRVLFRNRCKSGCCCISSLCCSCFRLRLLSLVFAGFQHRKVGVLFIETPLVERLSLPNNHYFCSGKCFFRTVPVGSRADTMWVP